jgi:ATP/maltotriose-dependent transcriptional regulator MalT
LQLANTAISASRAHPDSFCLSGTLCFAIVLANAAFDQAEELARELENVAQDFNVAVRHQVVHFLKGLLALHQGNFPAAVGHVQLCLATLPPPTLSFLRIDALQALAQAQRERGDQAAALAAINEAIELAQQTGALFSFPDLLKTRAEVLLAVEPGDQAAADDLLIQAMDCAREQGALSWELSVALVMYRAGASHDSREVAKEVLSGVFFRFTEGLETRDLKAAAQALLNI